MVIIIFDKFCDQRMMGTPFNVRSITITQKDVVLPSNPKSYIFHKTNHAQNFKKRLAQNKSMFSRKNSICDNASDSCEHLVWTPDATDKKCTHKKIANSLINENKFNQTMSAVTAVTGKNFRCHTISVPRKSQQQRQKYRKASMTRSNTENCESQSLRSTNCDPAADFSPPSHQGLGRTKPKTSISIYKQKQKPLKQAVSQTVPKSINSSMKLIQDLSSLEENLPYCYSWVTHKKPNAFPEIESLSPWKTPEAHHFFY